MTTRRNNLFYYRGACSAYSTILQILEEIKFDEERIKIFEEFHQSWLNKATAIATNKKNLRMDSCTIFTEHFYVTIVDGKYTIVDSAINGECFHRIFLWNEHTKTNYIIDFTGDFDSVIDFVDSDNELMINLPKALGINSNEIKEIDNPKVIYVIEDQGDIFYD